MSSLALKNMFDLSGRVALVTGGGSGIGLMIATGLATNGAKVYIASRRLELLEKVSLEWAQKNVELHPLRLDVTDRDSILAAKKHIEEKEGKLHILVNNSGAVGPRVPWLNTKDAPEKKDEETFGMALFNDDGFDGWADLYKLNTFSIYYTTSAFLGLLSKGSKDFDAAFTSSVVNITSISGVVKLAQNHFCYNSAKAAASHLTKMMSTEFALNNVPVRVNSVAPGVYASEMTFDDIGPDAVAKVAQSLMPVPAGRAGMAAEVAGTVIYLSTPAGCYTNGQEIVVDGGYIAVNPSTV
ncbi:short-chain dehydrogenase [Vararia minispora EC-137]|uniref:Short-chain dehydrogenase n=1 Tax=Vararia minispora EC-137 TaxID=1314806 RepID=A0ACB8QY61_9AGAM|nr:short-chain dehydrogenase [Vararia minispora EC-137]